MAAAISDSLGQLSAHTSCAMYPGNLLEILWNLEFQLWWPCRRMDAWYCEWDLASSARYGLNWP